MEKIYKPLSTGIPALDKIFQTIIPGDNLVWQVDSIENYMPFVEAFASDVLNKKKPVIYFRFANHPELLKSLNGVEIHHIDPEIGFEMFTAEIHKVIKKAGRVSFFVFDCLSDLPVHWYSDLMLGNFFILTCPFVYAMDSIAYFSLIRYHHSLRVAATIRETTQLLIDVYRYNDELYIHPLKVWERYSSTMYLPHVWKGDSFEPVTDSATISKVATTVTGPGLDSSSRAFDIWDHTFIRAQGVFEEVERGKRSEKDIAPIFNKLLKMVISRDKRVLKLAKKYLTLSDIFEVKKRLIGTGLIGGKSVGMLIARAILQKTDQCWNKLLEIHDSFYIGSDVFYTYTVLNGCWEVIQKQRDPSTFFDGIDEARQRILSGEFPQFIQEQFIEMFDYFGQSPIIVRSSSLLEDNFGNAFSGKYESVFCANQGTRRERLEAFLNAVRCVYASTMSEEALYYRARRGLLDRDEQMALLVQRVSGSVYGTFFLPQIAGVGLSFNPYVWSERIDPKSGMLRLVCGLGTRAVERHDEDYTRVVALNAPKLRPFGNFDEMLDFAQRNIDVIDLHANKFISLKFEDLYKISSDFPVDIVATQVKGEGGVSSGYDNSAQNPWFLTFDKLLSETTFVSDMRNMLSILQKVYESPVDIEFTANFRKDGSYQINLVQCRPLQIAERGRIVETPDYIKKEQVIIEAHGAIVGQSLVTAIERIIYVVPSCYGLMTQQERYAVAHLIGRLTHLEKNSNKVIMLMGPGRWGTTTPSLGVPVRFADINTVSVICEMVEMNENLIPDVSLGTHFFNDIVETQMLYFAVFPYKQENIINSQFIEDSANKLPVLLPEEAKWSGAVRVIDFCDENNKQRLIMNANTLRQQVLCYLENN
ncbi:PEP/pyruvate-binding domain-containing protein [Candidatus Latescibacterota bacterium]